MLRGITSLIHLLGADMGIISKIRSALSYRATRPLIYDEGMRLAYSTAGVAGGTLKGKTAVITGATSGIGYATAQRFLNEGCNVIIVGRNEDKLKECLSSLTINNDIRLEYVTMDSLDSQSLTDKVKKIFEECAIDFWINCAGILKKTDRDRKFRGVDAKTYFEVVNTNLKSNMVLIPAVADQMVAHGISGTIITVSSICGFTNHFGYTPYGISKDGVIEFTSNIAERYKGKINILTVAPGSVATRMGTTGFGKNIAGSSSFTHHVAIPEETASVIAFLSSPIGWHLNGQTILASAGESV